jgi:hypothetical protein
MRKSDVRQVGELRREVDGGQSRVRPVPDSKGRRFVPKDLVRRGADQHPRKNRWQTFLFSVSLKKDMDSLYSVVRGLPKRLAAQLLKRCLCFKFEARHGPGSCQLFE